MASSIIEAVGFVATGLSVAQFVPQVVRTARSGHLEGVSATTWCVLAGQMTAWIAYGLRGHLVPSLVTNLAVGVCVVIMIVLLVSRRADRLGRALAIGATLVGLALVLTAVFPSWVVGALAATLSTTSFAPQAIVAVRSTDLTGLSRSSWTIGVAASTGWCIYGLGKGVLPIYGSAAVAGTLSAIVVIRILGTRTPVPAG